MSKPTAKQMEHFYKMQEQGRINRANLQAFLESPNQLLAGFPVSYDQSIGLTALIERAVESRNLGNINSDITPERFPLKGTGVRQVKCRVEDYLNGETSEEAAIRLVKDGHTLCNTGDLAAFLHDHPEEVEKWTWVLAISEDSRWTNPDGLVCVPYAVVHGASRHFYLSGLRFQLDSDYGVLVLSE